ncbi:MAG: cytochrome-c oxidase, cbb3-type subunit II, partial [Thiobacillus sp.]
MNFNFKHEWIETNIGLMSVLTMLAISVGGLVEIAPLFFIDKTIEKVEGVRPYTALEQRGRDIYIREGCYTCHSQMIRPFRDEKLRYGHYSLAAESQYDHPFQWGSKRTGPDLARVGGKYSNEWHVQHMVAPRSMVPESVMPNYPWLLDTPLDISDLEGRLKALRKVGVPYSLTEAERAANVEKFGESVAVQLHIPDAHQNMIEQAKFGNYDGDPSGVSEMDALVAYL